MVAYCVIFLCLIEFGASYEFVQYPGFGYGSLTSTCIKGYTGESCRHKCPYPRFGSFCHEKCDCIKLLCNHIYGCKKLQVVLLVSLGNTVKNNVLIHTLVLAAKKAAHVQNDAVIFLQAANSSRQ